MAVPAVADLEMRKACVTACASGYGVFFCRRMLRVAVQTTNLCCVPAAEFGNCMHYDSMTFNAIFGLQFKRLCS